MQIANGFNRKWLLVHAKSSNEFHAFKIDQTGISAPVISNSGFYNTADAYKVGEMKFSPDYSRVVLANYNNKTVELHSFNNITGLVSNAQLLDTGVSFYGASFSPDGSKLYTGNNAGAGGLYQYDFTYPFLPIIQASKITIVSSKMGGMRIGPDQKIYLTIPYSYLCVIDQPNIAGPACNYSILFGPYPKGNAFETDLGSPFIPSCIATGGSIHQDTILCFGPGPQALAAPAGYSGYMWSDNTTLPTDTFSGPGTKWVICYNNCDMLVDTFHVTGSFLNNVATAAMDTTVCFYNNIPIVSAPTGYTNYLWSDGTTLSVDTFNTPGTKWVTAYSGCDILVDTITILPMPVVTNTMVTDTSVCILDNTITMYAPAGYVHYAWSDGTNATSDTFRKAGTKWVEAYTSCDILVDTIKVDTIPVLTTIASFDTTACLVNNVPIILSAVPGYTTYRWSDNQITLTDPFYFATTKWVHGYDYGTCRLLLDTVRLHAEPVVNSIHVIDTALCFANNIPVLTAAGGYTFYQWSDNTLLQTDTIGQPGTKWVKGHTDFCHTFTDTFKVVAAANDTTTIVTDTTLCLINNIPILSAPNGYTNYLWSDGFMQQADTFTQPGTKWVISQLHCDLRIDTFIVHQGYDTTFATIDTTVCVAYIARVVAAPPGYLSYLWSDGITQQADTFFATTTKTVIAQNGCNIYSGIVNFTAVDIPQDSIFVSTNDSTTCFESMASIILSAPGGYTDYLWNDGVPLQSNTFNGPGIKWVYAQSGCLMLVDTFHVYSMATDTTIKYLDTTVCFSKEVTFTAPSGYLTYLWNNGNSTPVNTISQNSVSWVNMHKACAEEIDTFKTRLVDSLQVSLGNDTFLCVGDAISLNASSVYNDAAYLWQDNSTASTYTITKAGHYYVKISVGPCVVSDTIQVHEKALVIDLGNGKAPCGSDELILDAGIDNASYSWQDGSTGKTFRATSNGKYVVRVTEGSCTATASVDVAFGACDCIVYIPDAFSPNNDGRNDLFGPYISCPVNGFEFRIYNRWGNLVFHTQNLSERWKGDISGTIQDNDLFYYYIQFKDDAGHNYYYKGDVTIVQ